MKKSNLFTPFLNLFILVIFIFFGKIIVNLVSSSGSKIEGYQSGSTDESNYWNPKGSLENEKRSKYVADELNHRNSKIDSNVCVILGKIKVTDFGVIEKISTDTTTYCWYL